MNKRLDNDTEQRIILLADFLFNLYVDLVNTNNGNSWAVKYLKLIYGNNTPMYLPLFKDTAKYLIKYKKENGCYPEQIEMKLSEWLLKRL